MAEFSRSLAAQSAAKCIVETAQEHGIITGPIAISPRLADAEKELIITMLRKIREEYGENSGELQSDEVSSLFTFVFGKAAEVVTNMYNHQPDKFELTGMLGGQIPVYADDAITEKFKTSGFPAACAENYLNWNEANASLIAATDPVLLLFEAIKWCFRLSCSYAVSIVEENKAVTGEN